MLIAKSFVCSYVYKWRKCHCKWSHSSSMTGLNCLVKLQICEKSMGSSTAQCIKNVAVLCKNHCEKVTQFWTSPSEEEEGEERWKKEKHFGHLATFRFGTFVMLSHASGCVVCLENKMKMSGTLFVMEILLYNHILRVHTIHTYTVYWLSFWDHMAWCEYTI